jgi:hypothetical protein
MASSLIKEQASFVSLLACGYNSKIKLASFPRIVYLRLFC